MNADSENGLSILRTTVEAALDIPLAIAVTSARPGDGKTAVAVGLARSFALVGYRTIVVDANVANPSVANALGVGRLRAPASLEEPNALAPTKITPFLDAASIADEALMDASSTVAVRSFIEDLRGRYAVTIWDAGDAFTSSLALACSAGADGTIVTIRFGRKPTSEDARLMATLEQVGGRIIGVVPTNMPSERDRFTGRAPYVETDTVPAGVRRAGKSIA